MANIDSQDGPYTTTSTEPEKKTIIPEESETKTLVDEGVSNQPDSKSKNENPENTENPDCTESPESTEKPSKYRKITYEAWKIIRDEPPATILSTTNWLGITRLVVRRSYKPIEITASKVRLHEWTRLQEMYSEIRDEYNQQQQQQQHLSTSQGGSRWGRKKGLMKTYEEDLDDRISGLELDIRRQLEVQINSRIASKSTSRHKVVYTVVALRELPGGGSLTNTNGLPMTTTTTTNKKKKRWGRGLLDNLWGGKEKPALRTEYRFIFEGREVNDKEVRWI